LTFGFHTAVQIATDAIDRLRTTAESHDRVIVVEVMGREAGWIATYAGIAAGADAILVPEWPYRRRRGLQAAVGAPRQRHDVLDRRRRRGREARRTAAQASPTSRSTRSVTLASAAWRLAQRRRSRSAPATRRATRSSVTSSAAARRPRSTACSRRALASPRWTPCSRALRRGEAEGFELAEQELIDHASHGDEHAAHRILQDAGSVEDERADADYGEADEEAKPD
jgi:hypothetical protein